MYRLIDSGIHGVTIIRIEDNTSVSPVDENPDYQAYLAWVAEGNEAQTWE